MPAAKRKQSKIARQQQERRQGVARVETSVTPAEREKLGRAAERLGMPLGRWMREALLGAASKSHK